MESAKMVQEFVQQQADWLEATYPHLSPQQRLPLAIEMAKATIMWRFRGDMEKLLAEIRGTIAHHVSEIAAALEG